MALFDENIGMNEEIMNALHLNTNKSFLMISMTMGSLCDDTVYDNMGRDLFRDYINK